jgi:hypothetical protein
MKSFSELPDFSFNGPSGPHDPEEDDYDKDADEDEDNESYGLGPVPAPVPVRPPRASAPSGRQSLRGREEPRRRPDLQTFWKQEPVPRPRSSLELTSESWLERGAEVLGWSLARLEYWLSKSGWLRAWLRLSLFVSIVLTAAGVFLIPAVARLLEETARSSHWFAAIVADLVAVITALPHTVISLGVLYLAFVVFQMFRRRRGPGRGYPREDYYQ